jgi:hypothetical protein
VSDVFAASLSGELLDPRTALAVAQAAAEAPAAATGTQAGRQADRCN